MGHELGVPERGGAYRHFAEERVRGEGRLLSKTKSYFL